MAPQPQSSSPPALQAALPHEFNVDLDLFDMGQARYKHIVLFGPPGVGKGAQAEILSHRFGLVHLSTGELIRDEIKRGSELGQRVEAAVGRGEFADDDTVLEIILQRIDLPEFQVGFVMDGFPRNIPQAAQLDEVLGGRRKRIDCALFFEAPDEVVIARLAGRRICSQCGTTYHKEFKRPRIHGICDLCHAPVVKRHDDSPEVHRSRLKTYFDKTRPLYDYYRKAGVLFPIDANQSIPEVAAAVGSIVGEPAR